MPRQPGPAGPRPVPVTWATLPDPDPDRVIEPGARPPQPGARRTGPGAGRPEPGARPPEPGAQRPGPAREPGTMVPRPQAEVGRLVPASPPRHPDPGPPPSWTKVTGTTLRLFLARRRTRWRVIAALVAALVVFAGGALTVALLRGQESRPATRAGQAKAVPGAAGLAQVQEATAARQEAAGWVAAQVSHTAVVACDPAMCASLQAQGFPAGNLMNIGPATSDPLGSTVIVATAAVRSQFGSRLESVYAPSVMASFGTGTARVDVRVYAPGGAAPYLAALRADQLTRQGLGRVLLHNSRVSATPAARAPMEAGQVDTRLLATLATLAGQGEVSIVGFGDSGPGASPGMPLREAELTSPPGAKSGYLPSLLALLRAQEAPYLATGLSLARVGGQEIVRIEFAAPSPLGLMSG